MNDEICYFQSAGHLIENYVFLRERKRSFSHLSVVVSSGTRREGISTQMNRSDDDVVMEAAGGG